MSDLILILAPKGRDAEVIELLLGRGGIGCLACPDIPSLCAHLAEDASGLLLTEEALAGPDSDRLTDWIAQQPPWSDLPVLVLATKQGGRRTPLAAGLLDRLGNVVILERPVNSETLMSGVRSALRGRRRQYQARTHLQERERNAALLHKLNETLETRVHERARELDEARETLAFALDSAGMGSWDLDLTTNSARRTLRHDTVFGYDRPLPHWGKDLFLQHVLDEDRPGTVAAFAEALDTGVLDIECRIRRHDGAVRWIAAKGRVAYAGNGVPQRMAGVVMDVTDRHFTEDALRQSQKMQAIGQLTGGLAHDFNNLLTGISGSLELLSTRLAQGRLGELDRYVAAAQGAAVRAASLTHRLLAFSRRQTLDPRPTSMNRLVADMEELIRGTVGPMIRLETRFAAAPWPTLCDPNQLENVLLNFCINARDAMPDGGSLVVETANVALEPGAAHERDLAPGEYAVLSVADTGCGMPPDVMARAFDPFFTTKPIGTGTGLGLSMAYGFARQSGGQVRIASVIGQGTTITLYLPRHSEDESLIRPGPEPEAPAAAEHGETVLVVDDEPTVRMLVTEVLQDLGYRAIEAGESTAALSIIESDARIDLMVTDVGLPGLNGRQLADAARALRPALKVLFITGYAENAALGYGHLAPGMHVMTKPFAMDAMAQRIRGIIAPAG